MLLPTHGLSTPPHHHLHHVLLQALGYTESDSAGQTNIFAVEPKSYVAGSSADASADGSQATLIIAGVAAACAAAAVAAGLLANSSTPGEF